MNHSRRMRRVLSGGWAGRGVVGIGLWLLVVPLLSAQEPGGGQQPADGEDTIAIERGTFIAAGRRVNVDLGTLEVPENRENRDSRTLELSFVRFKSTSPNPGSPIVYLAGGPGGSGIGAARGNRGRLFLALRQVADVIALDQRGTGAAAASLACPSKAIKALPLDRPGDPDVYTPLARQAAFACVRHMEDQGIDLAGYTTYASADDLDDLRRALGAEKLTLWGISYGTHLALATARRHPSSIDRMILAGVEGPDHTFKLPGNVEANFRALGRLAAADSQLAGRLPDLVPLTQAVLARLAQAPVVVEPIPGSRVVVGPWDLQKRLAVVMGSQSAMERVPAELLAMSRGDFDALGRWALGFRRSIGLRSAMSLAMDCASHASVRRLQRIRAEHATSLLGATIDYPLPEACDVPGLSRLGDEFRAPLESDIPVLFISGTLDGRTPVSNAEEVAAGFARYHHLVIERATHSDPLFLSSPAILETMIAFLKGEAVPDTTIEGPKWRFDPPYERSLSQEVLERLRTTNYAATIDWYHEQRRHLEGRAVYDFSESVLNALGYDLLRAEETDLALAVFRLNTEAYPGGFNTWDSLGEAYLAVGDTAMAILNYRKSLALNPQNANARAILSQLRPPPPPGGGRPPGRRR